MLFYQNALDQSLKPPYLMMERYLNLKTQNLKIKILQTIYLDQNINQILQTIYLDQDINQMFLILI